MTTNLGASDTSDLDDLLKKGFITQEEFNTFSNQFDSDRANDRVAELRRIKEARAL